MLPGSRRLPPGSFCSAASAEIAVGLCQSLERICLGRVFRRYVNLNAFAGFRDLALKLFTDWLPVLAATNEHAITSFLIYNSATIEQ
jgi:hypothetical protein